MDLEVTFAGVCMSVPNNDWEKATAFCVLLADATNQMGGTALDGTELPRHTGMLRVPLRNLGVAALSADDEVVHYLRRERVSFDVCRSAPLTVDLSPLPEDRQFVAGSASEHSFLWVLDMAALAPGLERVDPRALARAGASPQVLAQVVVDGGHLTSDLVPPELWSGEPRPSKSDVLDQCVAHRSVVRFKNIQSASIVITDMDDPSKRRSIALDPSAGLARVQISNMCDDNPLEWKRPARAVPDIDTKWLYSLLVGSDVAAFASDSGIDEASQSEVAKLQAIYRLKRDELDLEFRKALEATGQLPMPVPVGGGDSGPNCIKTRTGKATFSF